MAKIIAYEGKRIPSIEGYVIYRLDNDLIIRAKSGFTATGLKKNPNYEHCRMNATEFGGVSRMGKMLRMGLHPILPIKNRLAVVNAFTKKLHSLLVFDTTHVKGERTIATALTTHEGKSALMGYDFNPDSTFILHYTIADNHLIVQVENASAIKWIGLRLLMLDVNLATNESALHVGHLQFEKAKTKALTYKMPTVAQPLGTLFYLLEVEAFTLNDVSYVAANEPKGIFILAIAPQHP